MNEHEEFRRAVRAAGRRDEPTMERCLSEDELIAYRQRELEAAAMDRAQAHLVQCPTCRAAFREICDFFPAAEDVRPVGAEPTRQGRQALWRRIQAEEAQTARAAGGWRLGRWTPVRAAWALAAGLLIALVSLSGWALRLRQEYQQLARQWQGAQAEWAARRDEWERESRRRQQQADAVKRDYEEQLAERRRPQLNVPSYDIESQRAIQRSAGRDRVPVVRLPQSARHFQVTLIDEEPSAYPSYALEIRAPDGVVRWRLEEIARGRDGNFTLLLDRTAFGAGIHRFVLYGQRGGRYHPIAEYSVELRPAP